MDVRNSRGKFDEIKEKLARGSWAIDAVVGADLRRRGSDSFGRLRGSQIGREFRFNFASKEATIALDRGHDQAAIGTRSRGDRASIVDVSLTVFSWNRAPRLWHCFHHERSRIAARSRRDRGSIEPRSWSSSTNLPRRSMELQVSGRS